jgi:putative lipoprotein
MDLPPAEYQDEAPSTASKESQSRPAWVYVIIGAGVIALMAIALWALGVFSGAEPSPPGEEAFITIIDPVQGAVLPVPEVITIRGDAGGLFENSVVVQALDAQGNVLVQQPTTVISAEQGGQGPWSVDLIIPVKLGMIGLIFAFSSSPEDGRIMASASTEVTYGEALESGSEIAIQDPVEGSEVDTTRPVTVRGVGRGLFENNIVVEALDASGEVIAQQATTMSTEEVGGAGAWTIDLSIPGKDEAPGMIRAFSPSPTDGSTMAESRVAVTYLEGAEPAATPTPTLDAAAGIEDLLWSLTSLGGKTVIPGSVVRLDLTNGTASGSAGCNDYTGSYELKGSAITVGPLATTRKSCSDPAGLMEQEAQYLSELQHAEAFSLDVRGLRLFGSQSPVTLSYDSVVAGTVGMSTMAELPAGAVLTVQLQDVSRADATASALGESVHTDLSVVPAPFSVSFDPTRIDLSHTYAISARITDASGNLLYTSTQAHNVITRGNPSEVDILVEPSR